MATYTIIKLKNLSPLHIGTGKENYDFSASELQSDTISSALAAIRAQQGRSDGLLSFLDSFVISSAFPFWRDYCFLPKAQGKMDKVTVKNQEPHTYRKKLKKVKFIESALWQRIMKGECVEIAEQQICGDFLLPDAQTNTFRISKSQVSERVYVPRSEGADAQPFFFDWRFFDKEAGLYCLVDAEPKVIEELMQLFELLGANGIGTDRNVGGGKFDVEESTLNLDSLPEGNDTMLLSLYIPNENDFKKLQLEQSRYSLLLRGGYMSGSSEETLRHLRKKSIYMFGVGSVFKDVSKLEGKIVNLRPEWNDDCMHDVYRSGKPFCISVNM